MQGACTGMPQESASTPLPRVTAGRLERLTRFPSQHVQPRHVDIWLPPGYAPDRPHAVLYMHDGQMLFDPTTTWNRQAWQVDAVAAPLLASGALRDVIVVGIWNAGDQRFAEYFPQQMLAHLPAQAQASLRQRGLKGEPLADAYLRFLVTELKPEIDRRYATRRGSEDTLLMGSSMGGLISVYGLLRYPQVFGAAAALSTHWITSFEDNRTFPEAAADWLRTALSPAGALKLYMDHGTTELDGQYGRAQALIDAVFRERGFVPPLVVSRVFEGAGHNERSWSARLDSPLRFLLGR